MVPVPSSRKIDDVFGNTLSRQDKQSLATLYLLHPAEKMSRILQTEKNPDDWYKITLYRLIAVCRRAASATRSKRSARRFRRNFAYVLEELLTERGGSAGQGILLRCDRPDDCPCGRAKSLYHSAK